jgi:hypothetical protein
VAAAVAASLAPGTVAGAATSAPPVTHRTVYATRSAEPPALYRLRLDGTGTATSSAAVSLGRGATAADYAGGRMLFVRPGASAATLDDEIWLREASGARRFLAPGTRAVFSPDGSTVLIARRVLDEDPMGVGDTHDEYARYTLADGTNRAEFSYRTLRISSDLRYAKDGKSFWVLVQLSDGDYGVTLEEYRFSARRIVRHHSVDARHDCTDFEILPSGQRAVLACGDELRVVQLSTGAVTHRAAMPAGQLVTSVNGRLSATVLLISARRGNVRWLGALDLDTFRTRQMRGTVGYVNGVAAY